MANRTLTDIFIRRFEEYKSLGDKTLMRLSQQQMHFTPNETSNSIAIIVKHMHGNMMSRWTNFLTEDGEKPWRQRDNEFEADPSSTEEIIRQWEEGWNTLLNVLRSLSDDDFSKNVTIRSQPLTVADAIVRQLAHYSSHVGQIVFIGKMLLGGQWQSLSIPKGASQTYNDKLTVRKKGS